MAWEKEKGGKDMRRDNLNGLDLLKENVGVFYYRPLDAAEMRVY